MAIDRHRPPVRLERDPDRALVLLLADRRRPGILGTHGGGRRRHKRRCQPRRAEPRRRRAAERGAAIEDETPAHPPAPASPARAEALLALAEEAHQGLDVGLVGLDLDRVDPERAEQTLAGQDGRLAVLAILPAHGRAAGIDQRRRPVSRSRRLSRPTFGRSPSRRSAMQTGSRRAAGGEPKRRS